MVWPADCGQGLAADCPAEAPVARSNRYIGVRACSSEGSIWPFRDCSQEPAPAGCQGSVLIDADCEGMSRSGVYPNWLNAEHVKKSASGYGKYGTKQDCIEGALEELETMIEHYNHNCKAKMGSKMY